MVVEPVRCPHCEGVEVVAYGKTATGKQRFRCQNQQCERPTFLRAYSYQGCLPEVKRQIVEMTLNGSGVRDIARVLQISPTTVIEELKKRPGRSNRSTKPWLKGAVPRRSR
jgi:transposase-like protein